MKKKDEIAAELKALDAGFGDMEANDHFFHTPENYFQTFPDHMTSFIKAMNAESSFALPLSGTGPFSVPDGYFDQFSNDLLAKVSAADDIVLRDQYTWNDTAKDNPYHIPENYFTQFETRLFHKIFEEETAAQEELDALSPLLAVLKKEQPFSVPKSYFNSDSFTRQVQEQQEQSKVLEHPAVRSIKWARWAAAAAVIAIFTLGAFQFLVPTTTSDASPAFQQALARIPDARIKEWLSNNMDESDINGLGGNIANIKDISTSSSLNNFSEQEIEDYLEAETW